MLLRLQTFHGLPHDAAAQHFAVVIKVHHAALADGAMVASPGEPCDVAMVGRDQHAPISGIRHGKFMANGYHHEVLDDCLMIT